MVEWGALSVAAFTEAILNFLSNHQYESTLPSSTKEEVGGPHWLWIRYTLCYECCMGCGGMGQLLIL